MRLQDWTKVRTGLVMLLLIVSHRPVSAQTALFDETTVADTATSAAPVSYAAPAKSIWSAPPVKVSGYVAFAALQALDVASTLKALQQPGTREANPVFAGVVDSPVKFIALKAATTTATLLLMQRFSKNHPKASVLVMAGINSAYLFVVSSNFQRAAGH